MNIWIERLKRAGELRVIEQCVDVNLEMAHIAYAEAKKCDSSQALLFTSPMENSKLFDMPVLMNLFGSKKRMEMIFGADINKIAKEVSAIVRPEIPKTVFGRMLKLFKLLKLRYIFPRRFYKRGLCQAKVYSGGDVDLGMLPVLKTWENDGGKFITMGQVYTQSLDGTKHNVGMYRLQVYDKNKLGLHWQIHKDSSSFFDEYEKRGIPMPVSVAIGGDPLYSWCATAPLPKGIFELLLYGFIRRKRTDLIRCRTNDIFVPDDADIVIEGWVENPKERKEEGKFGDHTGCYTPKEPYPFMTVTAITTSREPIFSATVVGKPPIEDKYLGLATERVFLPLLQSTVPSLIDYRMPENGVFHNLLLAKIGVRFPAEALQAMHAFWGIGQMSFVKHAFFLSSDAPDLNDDEAIARYCCDRFSIDCCLISQGILDALDHSSDRPLQGGKLGVDLTAGKREKRCVSIDDGELFTKIKSIAPEAVALKQYMTDTANPITILQIEKKEGVKTLFEKLQPVAEYLAIVCVLDTLYNDVNNPYMSLWRICNNIDVLRDLYVSAFTLLDATAKSSIDGYNRKWPEDTNCTTGVIATLKQKGLWEFDDEFIKRYQM
ncbi:MAG: menaquinone biosynthesis decarboxylase [Helicobacteraceae bacterium]|nr:menaquinone biosynthesis decarboxylase [Helicobacteraceae bacterium]